MCLAVPGRILDVAGDDPLLRTARVDFSGLVKTVNLACVPAARPGDWVLVHVGFALHTLDADEAQRVLEELRRLDGLAELET